MYRLIAFIERKNCLDENLFRMIHLNWDQDRRLFINYLLIGINKQAKVKGESSIISVF